MSRGFKIFLFLLVTLATFSIYQGRESRLARIVEGFYAHVVEDPDEDREKPWRRALREYGEVNPVEGPLSIDGETPDVIVVEVQPDPALIAGDFIEDDEVLSPEGLPEGDLDAGGDEEILIADEEFQESDQSETEEPGDDSGTVPGGIVGGAEKPDDDSDPAAEPEPPSEEDSAKDYVVIEHPVSENDKLWLIARHYFNDGMRYKDIMAWNDLKSDAIRTGMRLKIRVPGRRPGSPGTSSSPPDSKPVARLHVHRVIDGETLASIARKYYRGNGDQWERIHRFNKDKIKNPDRLPIGLRLEIPEPLGGI